jgi:hypothetical protein
MLWTSIVSISREDISMIQRDNNADCRTVLLSANRIPSPRLVICWFLDKLSSASGGIYYFLSGPVDPSPPSTPRVDDVSSTHPAHPSPPSTLHRLQRQQPGGCGHGCADSLGSLASTSGPLQFLFPGQNCTPPVNGTTRTFINVTTSSWEFYCESAGLLLQGYISVGDTGPYLVSLIALGQSLSVYLYHFLPTAQHTHYQAPVVGC